VRPPPRAPFFLAFVVWGGGGGGGGALPEAYVCVCVCGGGCYLGISPPPGVNVIGVLYFSRKGMCMCVCGGGVGGATG
jgi:hypothetical protein